MPSKIGAVLLLFAGTMLGGSGKDLSLKELLYVLDIQSWRVRVPASDNYTWTFRVIAKRERKATSRTPSNLSKRADYLLALRALRENTFEFVLPGTNGSGRGILDLCERGLHCEYYSYSWFDKPEYSVDGDQCTLAEFVEGFGTEPTHYLVLVQTRSKPYEK